MESPLSPTIANIFMEDLETRTLDAASYKPDLWLRHVDDTFTIMTHGEDKLQTSHLNGLDPKIKFMEIENQYQLSFLDIIVLSNSCQSSCDLEQSRCYIKQLKVCGWKTIDAFDYFNKWCNSGIYLRIRFNDSYDMRNYEVLLGLHSVTPHKSE
ncbi:hypothetical protein Trydic_g3340 [Trypoxylus dichotomus]